MLFFSDTLKPYEKYSSSCSKFGLSNSMFTGDGLVKLPAEI